MQLKDFAIDLVDVLIVAFVFYRLLLVFRQTRAFRMLVGLGALALAYAAARVFQFEGLLGLVDAIRGSRLEIGVVVLAVIFADEIKDALAGMIWSRPRAGSRDALGATADQVARACASLAPRKVGALIAITKTNPLDRWQSADSVPVDAVASAQLLETLFDESSPLHDGAVIIRDGRIAAAKCQFPASSDPKVTSLAVGMRHRAAFGLCERSDAVVVAVSEERGEVSVFHAGSIHAPVEASRLAVLLRDLLGVEARRLRWYHPRRLAAHGALKALALCLAVALWADQESTFRVQDRVRVLHAGSREERTIRLAPGEVVVTTAGAGLVEVPSPDGAPPTWRQELPLVRYTLAGRNLDRLLLLPRLVASWVRGVSPPPSDLVGRIGVEIGDEDAAADLSAAKPIAAELVHTGAAFRLQPKQMTIELDRLVALGPDAIRVGVRGTPAPDYALIGDAVVPIALPGRPQLLVPSRAKERVEAILAACPSNPPVDVEGRTEFEEDVDLLVPGEVCAWNPGQAFRTRIALEILSAAARKEIQALQMTEEQRKELEAQRVEATRRLHEARERWAALDKGTRDGTWESDYRYERLETLTQRTLPDLASRIEKAAIEAQAVGRALERLRGETASGDAAAVLRARVTLCLKELESREQVLEAWREIDQLARQEDAAVRERLRPLLEAVDKAVRQKDEAAKAELQLPPVAPEVDLEGLIEPAGPAGAVRTEGAKAIAAAATGREAFLLFARGATGFQRWHDAVREAQTLTVEIESLRRQLSGAPPAGTSIVRLELALREKEALVEARRVLARRHAEQWQTLRPRIELADERFARETTLLERVTTSWPASEAAQLDFVPLLDLFKEASIEAPACRAAMVLVEEQLPRAQDADLLAETDVASTLWTRHLEGLLRRLSVLARILRRIAPAGGDGTELGLARAEEELARSKEAWLAAEGRRRAYADGTLEVRLDDLDRLAAERQAVAEELARLSGEREQLPPRDAEAALLASGVPGEELSEERRGALAEACLLHAQARCVDESIRRTTRQGRALEEAEAAVRPSLEPLLATMQARLAEIEQMAQSPQPERVAATAYLETRRQDEALLDGLEADLERGDPGLLGQAGSWEALVGAIAPLPLDDQGIEHLVAVEARCEALKGILSGLETDGNDPAVAVVGGTGSAAVEMRRRVRDREIEVRKARLRTLEETCTELRDYLVGTERIHRLVSRITEALTVDGAAAAPLTGLKENLAGLTQAIFRRKLQRQEAIAEMETRQDPAEKAQMRRRVAAIEARLVRQEVVNDDLGRLIERIERLHPPR